MLTTNVSKAFVFHLTGSIRLTGSVTSKLSAAASSKRGGIYSILSFACDIQEFWMEGIEQIHPLTEVIPEP